MGAADEIFTVESLINSVAMSALESGAISEVHILVGLFIVTIIALRKTSQHHSQTQTDVTDLSTKLDDVQRKLTDLELKVEIGISDIEQIRTDIAEIKLKIAGINTKL